MAKSTPERPVAAAKQQSPIQTPSPVLHANQGQSSETPSELPHQAEMTGGLPPKTGPKLTADEPHEAETSTERLHEPRIPFGTHQQKLEYPKRPGFHRHWFNDRPNRIARAKIAGYSHVLDDEGKPVCRPVGSREGGGGMVAYIMETPQQWFDEDYAAQQAKVDEIDKPIREGKLEAKPGDNRYVPEHSPIRFSEGR